MSLVFVSQFVSLTWEKWEWKSQQNIRRKLKVYDGSELGTRNGLENYGEFRHQLVKLINIFNK